MRDEPTAHVVVSLTEFTRNADGDVRHHVLFVGEVGDAAFKQSLVAGVAGVIGMLFAAVIGLGVTVSFVVGLLAGGGAWWASSMNHERGVRQVQVQKDRKKADGTAVWLGWQELNLKDYQCVFTQLQWPTTVDRPELARDVLEHEPVDGSVA